MQRLAGQQACGETVVAAALELEREQTNISYEEMSKGGREGGTKGRGRRRMREG